MVQLALGTSGFESAHYAGRSLSLDEAVTEALDEQG
jgi:hypothetical protein